MLVIWHMVMMDLGQVRGVQQTGIQGNKQGPPSGTMQQSGLIMGKQVLIVSRSLPKNSSSIYSLI